MSRTVYLDHHATTPLDERVFEAMRPYFVQEFGNPASTTHPWGRRAAEAVARARAIVAEFLRADPDEILFTSGRPNPTTSRSRARLGRPARRGGARIW